MKNNIATIVAAMLAGGAVVFGVTSAANSDDGTSTPAALGQPAAAVQGATSQQGAVPQQGARPGFGTPATGDAADKASAAATAKYDGTVEAVMELDDGSYVVHVITGSGELHVAVSKDFEVTGIEQGGPGAGGGPPVPTTSS